MKFHVTRNIVCEFLKMSWMPVESDPGILFVDACQFMHSYAPQFAVDIQIRFTEIWRMWFFSYLIACIHSVSVFWG